MTKAQQSDLAEGTRLSLQIAGNLMQEPQGRLILTVSFVTDKLHGWDGQGKEGVKGNQWVREEGIGVIDLSYVSQVSYGY